VAESGALRSQHAVTRLLNRVSVDDKEAVAQLFPLLYDHLRRVARNKMRGERHQSLEPTGLVHEAYLKLMPGALGHRPRNRAQFFAIAARAMRQVLIDRARERGAMKRGGNEVRVTLVDDVAEAPESGQSVRMLAIDRALTKLASLDKIQARVVEMRYFAGASIDEVAEAIGKSPGTVKRAWDAARAFLQIELGNGRGR
jgi:RNA polymerase sigma factor (TIGR02999 family)